jgi:predicted Fe-Mo cluster-binding NifX family protein
LQSQVSGHFGSAPLLLVVDTESQEISELQRSKQSEQPGRARLAQLLTGEPIDALVVSSVGQGAFGRLQASGVKVYQASGETISENLLSLAEQSLQEFSTTGLCSHGKNGAGHGQKKQGHGQHHGAGHGCGCH